MGAYQTWQTWSGVRGSPLTSAGSSCPSSERMVIRPTTGGVVEGEPGLYFVGLLFLYSLTSSLVGGVGRDSEYVSGHIAAGSPTWPARQRGDRLPIDVERKAS